MLVFDQWPTRASVLPIHVFFRWKISYSCESFGRAQASRKMYSAGSPRLYCPELCVWKPILIFFNFRRSFSTAPTGRLCTNTCTSRAFRKPTAAPWTYLALPDRSGTNSCWPWRKNSKVRRITVVSEYWHRGKRKGEIVSWKSFGPRGIIAFYETAIA